jgi:hypothetical protein
MTLVFKTFENHREWFFKAFKTYFSH